MSEDKRMFFVYDNVDSPQRIRHQIVGDTGIFYSYTVPKKNEELRLCVDYRGLNQVTINALNIANLSKDYPWNGPLRLAWPPPETLGRGGRLHQRPPQGVQVPRGPLGER